ncbi:hypothetical protein [Limnoraphis robusta]
MVGRILEANGRGLWEKTQKS